MESLITNNECKERWYPISIDRYRGNIKLDMKVEGAEQLRNNIAYNLQYLQYIQKQQDELKLSSVLYVMLCKTYIISGMGIIEGVFSNLLKSRGLWNDTIWQSRGKLSSNEGIFEGKKIKVETELFEKVESYEMRMDLDSMIKKVEAKKLLSIEHEKFPVLKRLRHLRNRIHLQQIGDKYDTDYYNFSKKEKEEMGNILYSILIDEVFCNLPEKADIYEFLKR